MRKTCFSSIAVILAMGMMLSGCGNEAASQQAVAAEEVSSMEASAEVQSDDIAEDQIQENIQDGVRIVLSDEEIRVDGELVSEDAESAVYVGADMIYYEEGMGELYGAGEAKDEHSKEEADKHTVITITQPGTYVVSGKLSYGQLVIDLGKDADEDENAVVHLVLDGVDLNCEASSAILVLHAYECGDDSEENATPTVDTTAAGFQLYLVENSTNVINGSYVAKIYKDGTTKEDLEEGKAKKKYKFDAAIDSKVSFNIDAGENGKLIVNAENEGISSSLHMTINGGIIEIHAADDSINTNEDNVSVFTMNDGVLTCDSGLGAEGDGIDSNGYIVINGGYITSCANPQSMDSGVDSDCGIYLNGGTLIASGNMYDEVSEDSAQLFMTLSFDETVMPEDRIMVTDENDNPLFAFEAVNQYTIAVYSSPELTEGTYHLYKVSSVTGDLTGSIYTNITEYTDAVQLQTSGSMMMGGPGMGGAMPVMAEGEMPENFDPKQFEGNEPPERPEGDQPPMMQRCKSQIVTCLAQKWE